MNGSVKSSTHSPYGHHATTFLYQEIMPRFLGHCLNAHFLMEKTRIFGSIERFENGYHHNPGLPLPKKMWGRGSGQGRTTAEPHHPVLRR
jgi:hypothetical protein